MLRVLLLPPSFFSERDSQFRSWCYCFSFPLSLLSWPMKSWNFQTFLHAWRNIFLKEKSIWIQILTRQELLFVAVCMYPCRLRERERDTTNFYYPSWAVCSCCWIFVMVYFRGCTVWWGDKMSVWEEDRTIEWIRGPELMHRTCLCHYTRGWRMRCDQGKDADERGERTANAFLVHTPVCNNRLGPFQVGRWLRGREREWVREREREK